MGAGVLEHLEKASRRRGHIFTFGVSGYERQLIADESECLGGVWRN